MSSGSSAEFWLSVQGVMCGMGHELSVKGWRIMLHMDAGYHLELSRL